MTGRTPDPLLIEERQRRTGGTHSNSESRFEDPRAARRDK
jgi:hypothetical protein